jgi:glycosyltransferase involved in cell wall biosynthesis
LKRVCILTSVHAVNDIRVFQRQARSLAAAGYDVTYIVPHENNETVDGVRIVALPFPKNRSERVMGTMLKTLRLARKEKADVYHFHDPELLPVGLLLKWFTRAAVIYDVHEDYRESISVSPYMAKSAAKMVASWVDDLEQFASTQFDAVVAATDHILQKFTSAKKAICVHNYPVVGDFPTTSAGHSSDDAFKIIYEGHITKDKGIEQTIKAIELIEDVDGIRLQLCGRFIDAKYERHIKRLKGYKNVDYLGWLDKSALYLKLREAVVGIICLSPTGNNVNALPNKLFEYMAAGLPLITSDFPIWKDLLAENKCGLTVNPLNPKDIAEKIMYLYNNPEEAKKMGENSRKAASTKYNWESEKNVLLDLYNSL